MDTADRVAYLARIGYRGAIEPSPAVLSTRRQTRHASNCILICARLRTVDFESSPLQKSLS